MHKLDNGLYYSVRHYRLPEFDCGYPKKGRPPKEFLARYIRGKKAWLVGTFMFGTFIVSPHPTGGATGVCVYDKDKKPIAAGIARCSMSDTFSYTKGRELALERALAALPK